jgi:hypothetical protein
VECARGDSAAGMRIQEDMFPDCRSFPELEKDERFTPQPLWLELDREFGFTLDACATAESAKCKRFFTRAEDGLAQSWACERVWCNPPWSDIRPWVEKAWHARAELVAMLVPAWTDREWWQELVEPARDLWLQPSALDVPRLTTRFLRRFSFGHPGNPNGVGVEQPNFWTCLLVWQGRDTTDCGSRADSSAVRQNRSSGGAHAAFGRASRSG